MQAISNAPSRAEHAYLTIRAGIIDGTFPPDAHLVQEDLAAQLGVSRQPVQQAMALLKADGLVVGSGARSLAVAPLDPVDTARRYKIRAALEALAVREAVTQAARAPAFASKLRREGEALLEAGSAMVAVDAHIDAVTHDLAFHSFLCRASGNPLLERTLELHWLYIRRVMIAVVRFAHRGPTVWREHREILNAIVDGRIEEAVARLTAHVYGAEGALTEALARMKASGSGRADPPA